MNKTATAVLAAAAATGALLVGLDAVSPAEAVDVAISEDDKAAIEAAEGRTLDEVLAERATQAKAQDREGKLEKAKDALRWLCAKGDPRCVQVRNILLPAYLEMLAEAAAAKAAAAEDSP